jgi:hypothetical protein
MKGWLVLLSADAVMSWWFANSLRMVLRPDEVNGFVWWPRFCRISIPATLSRRRVQVLGFLGAVSSGVFLMSVLLPGTAGLVLKALKR